MSSAAEVDRKRREHGDVALLRALLRIKLLRALLSLGLHDLNQKVALQMMARGKG